MSTEPTLAVVVIVLVGGAALQRCLTALQHWPASIVVVGRVPAATALRARGVTVIESEASVPQRRAIGATAARAPWVSFCEDTCAPAVTWWKGFLALQDQLAYDAWSGPITIEATLPPRYLALAAHEYGEFAPGRWQRLATASGTSWRPVKRLAGLNVVYRAAALPAPAPPEGLIETELHEHLQASGRPLAIHPDLAVVYGAADPRNATVRARFTHGRVYGGGLRSRLSPALRMVAIVRCVALPAVLFWRGWAGLPHGRRGSLTTCLWLLLFASAWSTGEAFGLTTGRGDSLERWH